MPIYAYRCETCGFEKDVLQKLSDPQLTDCPSCGKSTFKKQVTAAGFQLKGSGWYVTDFRNGSGGKKPEAADKKSESAESAAPAAAPAPAPAPAAASAPAAKTSGSSE
jgi:putative FmdB family regulatory protein